MAGMTQLCKSDNFARAWRWLRSNADANYKGHFRKLYGIYAIADEELLEYLRSNVSSGRYEPGRSCKLFSPKASGILRPYSLLNIEDQIVYQACANVIAEKLYPKVRRRYYEEVFGHLYAGKKSKWFYRKWSDGYKAFNDKARKAFNDGCVYSASFDLTACYDSIDHGVLKHFLCEIGCDRDFVDTFVGWLSNWTATESGYFHNHGIPQGPLSSGLISEVVLKYFDEKREKTPRIKYLRYVDDIKLFAKSEAELRSSLVRLDLLSKDIGLFPQSSKISIHKVKDIEEELKSISNPTEPSVKKKAVDQDKLIKRIIELTPRFSIENPTRFKYLLAHAEPSSKLVNRLWRIYEKHPEIYLSFTRYLSRYKVFPRKLEERVLTEIKNHKLYDAITAAFINSSNGRMTGKCSLDAVKIVQGRWKPTINQPDLQAATATWLITHDSFSYASCQTAAFRTKSWWAKAIITSELDDSVIGKPSLEEIANKQIRHKSQDVSLAGALLIFVYELSVKKPYRDINPVAGKVLRSLGLIRRAPGAPCYIELSLKRMADVTLNINWRAFFGAEYKDAERQIIRCRSYADTDVNGWVNSMDVFLDRMLDKLFVLDGTIGGYKLGRIGSVLHSPRGRFAIKYPETYSLAERIHDARTMSDLSHPVVRGTRKATGRIKYDFLIKSKPFIRKSVAEIKAAFGL